MANATKYVDNVNGDNGNTGDSEAQAYADLATALAAITGGGNTIYLQAGSPYVYTATETFPSGLKGDTTDGVNRIIGYTTTPGAADGMPIITSATNSANLFTVNDNDYWDFHHLKFTHTASTRGIALFGSTSGAFPIGFYDCVFDGVASATGTSQTNELIFSRCEIANCTGTNAVNIRNRGVFYACRIHDNDGNGIAGNNGVTNTMVIINCVVVDNGGHGLLMTTSVTYQLIVTSSILSNNGSDGINIPATTGVPAIALNNNIIYGNGGEGIDIDDEQGVVDAAKLINYGNAFGGNTSGNYSGISAGEGELALTADPFVDSASGNYNINSTSGGGLVLREGTLDLP